MPVPYPGLLRGFQFNHSLSFKVFIQELKDLSVSFDLVFLLHETMPFIREYYILYRDTILLNRFYDLIGLNLQDPGVIGTLKDQVSCRSPLSASKQ